MHGLISSPATKHRAMRAPGRAEYKESTAGGLKWKALGETLAILCGFLQREGWFCL